MPTDPFKQLFDLELSKAAAKERIEAAVTLLEEIRNYGHMLFARCAYRPEGGDENIAILFLYYHLLEMLDAVGVLIAESAPVPAELQVRAMLKADTARRARRFVVAGRNNVRRMLSRLPTRILLSSRRRYCSPVQRSPRYTSFALPLISYFDLFGRKWAMTKNQSGSSRQESSESDAQPESCPSPEWPPACRWRRAW